MAYQDMALPGFHLPEPLLRISDLIFFAVARLRIAYHSIATRLRCETDQSTSPARLLPMSDPIRDAGQGICHGLSPRVSRGPKSWFNDSLLFLFLVAAMSSEAGYATSLGRLTVNSVQGQPFKAEIDLVAVKKEERFFLNARLAPHDVFRKVNVDYSPILSTFKTTIEIRSGGQPYIRIVSPQPITEPFLNILIELNWPSGHLLREYTALLPLPEADEQSLENGSGQAEVHACSKADSNGGKTDLAMRHDIAAGQARLVPAEGSPEPSYRIYGPVKPGDTLSGIVKNIVLPPEVSFNQMLVALFRANPRAFFGNNMHQLKMGLVLRIPDSNEINAITIAEANQEVRAHTTDWHKKWFPGTEEGTKEPGTVLPIPLL